MEYHLSSPFTVPYRETLMSDPNQTNNRAVWFDIPVVDLQRACKFYGATLAIKVDEFDADGTKMAVLEHTDGNGGCLYEKPDWISSTGGLLVYMNVEGRIRDAVVQTTEHGGKVLEETHPIGPHGFRAVVLDSEGNRIALHSSVDA